MISIDSARTVILRNTRTALGRRFDTPVAPIPASARVPARVAGDANSELDMLLGEIAKLGGTTRRMSQKNELDESLRQLAQTESIWKATSWETAELAELGIAGTLRALGVEIVSPYADKYKLAECDLGVTGVDAALPETGTLVLRSSPDRPRSVSLLPRVHLAILRPTALRADLAPVFSNPTLAKAGYFFFVTGPSRTSDIELTSTIGVHGPKALWVWAWEGKIIS